MSVDQYCAMLIDVCAYVADESPTAPHDSRDAPDAIGYADRYGGGGLAGNGGSGRTVLVNGYLVKGVGRTPLIGLTADKKHCTGAAYLQESVRETIFAEIVAAEFPHSAVCTIAIIDTGISVVWNTPDGPKEERRVLLVRRAVIRAAHFERSVGFVSKDAHDGVNDWSRVSRMIGTVAATIGHVATLTMIDAFWTKWATQLGYSVAHRLTQGGNFSSNIAIDGQLLDFGTASALPSWASIVVLDGAVLFGNDLTALTQALNSMSYYLGRHLDPDLGLPPWRESMLGRMRETYSRTFFIETLRVCGLGRRRAEELAAGAYAMSLVRLVKEIFAHFRGECFDISVSTPTPRIKWDLADIWADNPPAYLLNLSRCLKKAVPEHLWANASARAQFLARPRTHLFREEARAWIYDAVEGIDGEAAELTSKVTRAIQRATAAGRRDGSIDQDGLVPIGFAVGERITCSLFRDCSTDSHVAHVEWLAPSDRFVTRPKETSAFSVGREALHLVRGFHSDGVEFDDERIGNVDCAVCVAAEQ